LAEPVVFRQDVDAFKLGVHAAPIVAGYPDRLGFPSDRFDDLPASAAAAAARVEIELSGSVERIEMAERELLWSAPRFA
jgi:hypothetical protein